jgi:hypothetical protein
VTRPKSSITFTGEIQPDQFYRTVLAPALFGIGWQSTKNKIRSGDLPAPFGSPEGWTGRQILDWRAEQQRLAAEKLAARRSAEKQSQPKNFIGAKQKTRKRKLQSPVKSRQRQRAGA